MYTYEPTSINYVLNISCFENICCKDLLDFQYLISIFFDYRNFKNCFKFYTEESKGMASSYLWNRFQFMGGQAMDIHQHTVA